MVFTATARWDFRGEAWFSTEIEATSLDVAGALFYSMLPITFFRGKNRLVAVRPQSLDSFEPRMLAERATEILPDICAQEDSGDGAVISGQPPAE
jgi:hypothetical protein